MPFDKPSLDSRSFDQLADEAKRKIPQLAPRWTNHNTSNPGITLSELVAALVEQDLFRLDRIPDRQMRGFLRLVGIEQKPPGVARGFIALGVEGAAVSLPGGMQVAAGDMLVETTRPVRASTAKIISISSTSGGVVSDLTQTLKAATDDVALFGDVPADDATLAIAFDAALGPPGAPVDLAVWRADPEADAATWAALIAEWRAARRDARLLGRLVECERPLREHDDVTLAWDYWSAAGAWTPLAVKDTTRCLSLSGWLRFAVPPDHAPGGGAPGRYVIRARIARGRYTCPPMLRGLRLNGVPVRHAALIDSPDPLGTSHGRPSERFPALRAPIVAGSAAVVWTKDAASDPDWREAATWDLVGAHDKTFVLDPTKGAFSFGNGWRGRVPSAEWIASATYRIGGGPAGNLVRGALHAIPPTERNKQLAPGIEAMLPGISVEQPAALFGGAPAETLAQAKARAVDRIGGVTKAVSLADYEALAEAVPAVAVAPSRAYARRHPMLPSVIASGCVTVVVIPDCPGPRPTPQPGFLRAVAAWLDRRRMITADVRVMPPCYEEVAVAATLHVGARAQPAKARQAALAMLDAFFHPLTGGPDGDGWRVGRPVYRTEVMALLASIDGVEAVTDLGFASSHDPEQTCANLEFCGDCLPVSGAHVIAVNAVSIIPPVRRSERHERC